MSNCHGAISTEIRHAFPVYTAKIPGGQGELPAWAAKKLEAVNDRSMRGLELMQAKGLKIGFGTDLLGQLHTHQTREFHLRQEVQPAIDILRSATSVNADILQEPTLGRLPQGCEADVLVVDGDPLRDVGVLAEDGRRLLAVMKAGRFLKRAANLS
jgi:imidazolonepropionase-like amidohydrolase